MKASNKMHWSEINFTLRVCTLNSTRKEIENNGENIPGFRKIFG